MVHESITCSECGHALNVTEANMSNLDLMVNLAVEPCEVCLRNAAAGYDAGDDPLDYVPPESDKN